MTIKERASCINTIKLLQRLAFNVHGVMDVIDAENCDKIIKMLEQPTAQQWIPCSERLPDEDYWSGANHQYSADVLMTVHNADDEETIIDYGHTIDGTWYSDTTDCIVPSEWKVLAWMPLPEPWKGEQQ